MKSIKTAVCGALALAVGASLANATTIYINGSTAYRTTAVNQIHAMFDVTTPLSLYYGYTGSSETGQNAGIYSGNINGTPYVVKTSWTGSESGIQATADTGSFGGTPNGGTPVSFVEDSPTKGGPGTETPITTAGLSGIDDPSLPTPTGTFVQVNPMVTFSDTYQATSKFKPGANIAYVNGQGHTFAALKTSSPTPTSGSAFGDGIVGVVPFNFWITGGTNSTVTSINDTQIKTLYSKGFTSRAYFSGINGDETKRVYALSRNPDSGSRLTVYAVSGVGALSTTKDYEPTVGGAQVTANGSTIDGIRVWPADTVNQIKIPAGNSGFNSSTYMTAALSSNTASMVNTDDNTPGGDLIGYTTGSVPNATALTYNGATRSINAIEEGQYALWGYEHLYYSPNIDPTVQSVLDTKLATAIYNAATTSGSISIPDMHVSRTSSTGDLDGQPIQLNYSNF